MTKKITITQEEGNNHSELSLQLEGINTISAIGLLEYALIDMRQRCLKEINRSTEKDTKGATT